MLYKFRAFTKESKERTLEIISKQELFFASIESFNDPFDGRVHLRFDGKLNEIKAAQIRVQYTMNLKKDEKFEGVTFEKTKTLVDSKINEAYLRNNTELIERLKRIQLMHNQKGVLSLSSKCENILMWSHYTYNHRGLCFGFEFSDEEVFAAPKKVRYQTHYDDIWGWLHTDEEIVNRILYSKAIDWQYEDEYRIVKNTTGVEIFKPESLKEIIFGCLMNSEEQKEIIETCERWGLKPRFKKAVLDVETYNLNIVDYVA